jgi:hypothetical protein
MLMDRIGVKAPLPISRSTISPGSFITAKLQNHRSAWSDHLKPVAFVNEAKRRR